MLLAFLVTRILVCAVGWFAYETFPHSTEHGVIGSAPWQFLFRWDAVHYYQIATGGYELDIEYPTVPFFPLLPLGLRALAFVTGGSIIVTGFFLSNALLLVSAIILRRLVELDFPPPSSVPQRTVWLLLLTPMTFFFSAIYTESLFLCLALTALLLARRERWLLCSLAGTLATASRPNAIILMVPLLAEAVSAWRGSKKSGGPNSTLVPAECWLVLVPSGLIAYAVYLQCRFGDALAFWHSQRGFGREALTPWRAFADTFHYPPPDAALFIATACVAVGLCIAMFFLEVRRSYVLFACAMTAVCLSSTWYALPRYLSVVFPFYLALVLLTRRSDAAFIALATSSAAVMAICLGLFVTGYPVI